MNVDRHNFPSQLLNILESIASADFIAIDFEFSGVARNNSKHSGRTIQTLQERYVEVKAAASRYQILQVGITTAHQIFPSRTRIVNLDDIPEQSFELRTYNIDLCPTIEDDLEVDRDFVLQSSAAEFLLANRFNFEKPFTHGLRYLSRAEEAVARQAAKSRSDKSRFGPIQLSEEDTDALAFVEKVRMEVQEWLDEYRRSDTLWIMSRLVHWRKAPPLSSSGRPSPEHELTGFNKKLVHQLLKAEFPELIALSRASGMVISHIDPAREKQLAKNRARRANDHINIQIGFRWIAEALCGGSIRDINLKSLAVDEHGNRTNFDFYESSRRHSDITRKLESHKPVLVGHNAFGDLIYLYQNFLGDLPDTVEEFGSLIRGIFPVVVDTKYMATHDSGSATSSSLDQIMSNLENEMRPKINMHPNFVKYQENDALHEAGFDSYQTARIMILLSAKLYTNQILEPFSHLHQKWKNRTSPSYEQSSESVSSGMPSFDDQFWTAYGNRLRVFGTAESFMELNPPPRQTRLYAIPESTKAIIRTLLSLVTVVPSSRRHIVEGVLDYLAVLCDRVQLSQR